MVKKQLKLNKLSEVQAFNRICTQCDFDVDLSQGRYLVDAKSVMGIYCLDINSPIEIVADTDDEALFAQKFGDYIA